jgi:hypothetical protein
MLQVEMFPGKRENLSRFEAPMQPVSIFFTIIEVSEAVAPWRQSAFSAGVPFLELRLR